MYDVVVVGGGASGVTSAIKSKKGDNKVLILERNSECLKKILITGNGRCNYFNENQNIDNYFSSNIDLINEIVTDNNIKMVKSFFDSLGIIPKIRDGYYYPFSNQAITIKNVLLRELERKNIKVKNNFLVTEIIKEEDIFIINPNTDNIRCKKLVLATGSYAYPKTGSTGMGYEFLKKFNHKIIKPLPALVQVEANFKYLKEWSGVRSEVKLELYENDKFITSELGEAQFTDYGLSGICTFNLSVLIARGLDIGKREVIKINFLPFVKEDRLTWLEDYNKGVYGRSLLELLEGLLNYKLAKIILNMAGINYNAFFDDLTLNEKNLLINNLFSMELEITGTKSFDNSQVCSGGVSLTDIDITTCESKLVKNLYIAGELLDLTGKCGGYNLTIAWLSGLLIGKSIGDDCD
ncbi:MAG: aminoacetone oxidase family FAD-binding enzyme [Bacilli bacterium]|nr:aminoacetone oxidase family FAD-binding enzyme [Bacilli bacterium]